MSTLQNPRQQRERMVQIVKRIDPSASVEFDDNAGPSFVRFCVMRGTTFLSKVFPSYHCSEVADRSDDQLEDLLRSLCGGLL
jgi:hypothetical protein